MTPTTFDALSVVEDALGTLSPQLFAIAGSVITVGVGLLALGKGWGLVKKFI